MGYQRSIAVAEDEMGRIVADVAFLELINELHQDNDYVLMQVSRCLKHAEKRKKWAVFLHRNAKRPDVQQLIEEMEEFEL